MTTQRVLPSFALLALFALSAASAQPQSTTSGTQTAANAAAAAPASGPSAAGASAITPATPALPHFDLADVHASPFSNQPFMRGGDLHGELYTVHQASMVDLIANAWSIDNDRVLRGPSWLDIDRFDISAKAPHTTSKEDVKLMLRSLLADRFSLVARPDTKAVPAFVLSVGKNGPKMKPSESTENHGCDYVDPPKDLPAGAVPYNTFRCRGTTMDELAQNLHDWAGAYVTSPSVNETNLPGAYDFEIKWTSRGQLARAGADGISLFDAVEKQLGLKLEAKPAPLPVVYVESVNEKPTPNAPGIETRMPPPPPMEFDVAILKPSSPDTKGINGQVTGNQVNLIGAPVQWMITWAWGISDDMVADAPKWMNEDRWDLLAKVAHDPSTPLAKGQSDIDYDALQAMVKKLLAERFGLQVHMEERPADAYTLIAVNPHMKKADPDNRTGCHEGPGPDGKDPRIANPILGRLLTCQNMTMAQFGDQLRIQANGYIHSPVLDQTGLKDAYDFTLSFSTIGQTRQPAPKDPNAPDNSGATASDPNGALSLLDAVQKQLGVKLEKQKRPVQMLVIDHVNQKPTDN